MKGYGLPRTLDIEFPDLADIRNFGLKTSTGALAGPGGDFRGSTKVHARTTSRRYWKKLERTHAKRDIYNALNTYHQERNMAVLEQHILDGSELLEWFHLINNRNKKIKRSNITIWNGIIVTTAVRNEILLSVDSSKITLDGKVEEIKFQNMHGGIWRAHIYNATKQENAMTDLITLSKRYETNKNTLAKIKDNFKNNRYSYIAGTLCIKTPDLVNDDAYVSIENLARLAA